MLDDEVAILVSRLKMQVTDYARTTCEFFLFVGLMRDALMSIGLTRDLHLHVDVVANLCCLSISADLEVSVASMNWWLPT